ncbi:hypothetical protein [Pollutibacter soli]|uniref:hypothetical protein n=1 Tax=Pollutibacter soli TaxID=3034157 RepID=UPI003013ECB2
MARAKKKDKNVEISANDSLTQNRLPVDETGEQVVWTDDPESIPPPEEELETTPPYEPPPAAEGP